MDAAQISMASIIWEKVDEWAKAHEHGGFTLEITIAHGKAVAIHRKTSELEYTTWTLQAAHEEKPVLE